MKNLLPARAIFFLGILFAASVSLTAQEAPPAFFSTATLTKILEHRDCEGIRFYNVALPGTTELSTMAIGIRADESEISNFANRYQVFSSKDEVGLASNKLSQRKAAEACRNVKERGEASFAASFSKSQLTEMLKVASSDGLIVRQKKVDEKILFEAQGGTLREGELLPIETSEMMLSGEPCPTFCGDSRNYVHL